MRGAVSAIAAAAPAPDLCGPLVGPLLRLQTVLCKHAVNPPFL